MKIMEFQQKNCPGNIKMNIPVWLSGENVLEIDVQSKYVIVLQHT
jgi:hypothetical protein